MTNPYATIRAALESIRVCDDMTGEREAALAALAELEKELAAAVAERDGLGDYRSEFEPIWDGLQDALEGERQINNYGLGESEVECVRRVLRERDILRARLAAIDAAPVVAWQDKSWRQDLYHRRPDPAQVDTRELIAKPAKD